MPANGSDDVTPGPQTDDRVTDPRNRELVTFLGNMIVETKQHHLTLIGLYNLLRGMVGQPNIEWQHQLVTSEEKHIERSNEHVTNLKTALGVG